MEGYGQKTNGTGGGIGGSGTVNFVAKFTPNGLTIGDSQIFDNGTNVGVGTDDPLGKFHVFGGNNPTRVIIDAEQATNAKILSFRTAGSPRWAIRVESGAGTTTDNLNIRAYDNSGALAHTPINIVRNSGFVGINITSALSAQLHVKGTGNTSGTFAFRVDSSTANDLFTIKDNGNIGISSTDYSAKVNIVSTGVVTNGINVSSESYGVFSQSIAVGIRGVNTLGYGIGVDGYSESGTGVKGDSLWGVGGQFSSNTAAISALGNSIFYKDTYINPLAIIHIKSNSNTSATTAFRVDSSTVDNILTIRDDGAVIAKGLRTQAASLVSGEIYYDTTDGNRLKYNP